MKTYYYLLLVILVSACVEEKQEPIKEPTVVAVSKQIVNEEIQEKLDSAGLNGAVLIYDLQEDTYYSNNYKWCNQGKLPASTFKIPNSIIALETGIATDENSLFKWDGEKRRNKNWNKDLILKDAFHFSCVPCYQDIARKIGVKRMNQYLSKLNYGNMLVDSSNIDMFWLEGNSKINQLEQIDFLKRFYQAELPITESTQKIMKKLMVIEENKDYTISGKTGWAMSNGNDNGWFVGYLETKDQVYFFATNVEPAGEIDFNTFPRLRKEVTDEAFKILNIIPK